MMGHVLSIAATSFDAAFGGLPSAPAVAGSRAGTIILDEQNVESALYKQLARNEPPGLRKVARYHDALLVRRFEHRWLRRASVVTTCSSTDAGYLKAEIASTATIAVIPNGVDTSSVEFYDGPRDQHRMIMVGGLSYAPNVDAAAYLVHEVMPRVWRARPDVVLELIGANPTREVRALQGPRVSVIGTVPDTRPYLRRAALEIVPLRSGGGTRLKILEAMAAGTPIVSTTRGAEGLDVQDGVHLRLADTADALTTAILATLASPRDAAAKARAARQLVVSAYDWREIGHRFTDLIEASVFNGAARD